MAGIAADGALLIQDASGVRHRVVAGEVVLADGLSPAASPQERAFR
jgi:hypothetical protein